MNPISEGFAGGLVVSEGFGAGVVLGAFTITGVISINESISGTIEFPGLENNMIFIGESGNTIKVQCTFTDANDELIDVNNLELRIFDKDKNQIDTVSTITRVSEGIYYALYTLPESMSVVNYFCSFHGNVGGNTVVERDRFQSRFWVNDV